MLVKCLKNTQACISEKIRKYAFNQDSQGVLPLTIHKPYIVSAKKHQMGLDFYLILDDEGKLKGFPWWYPANLFQIADNARPADWIEVGDSNFKITGFSELANDPDGVFYNSLEDGEREAVEAFMAHYKTYALMHNIWYAEDKLIERNN